MQSKRSSIGRKMYIFIGVTVFLVAFGVSMLTYSINVHQIDGYFKNLTITSARNFASFIDVDFYKQLKSVAESEEYQALRDDAEEKEDEQPVVEYLKEKGLWDAYCKNREILVRYLTNMDDLKYLYVIVWGEADDARDMYLMDDDKVPVYETGYFEKREDELKGKDPSKEISPTISNGDWGWLCSAFVPIYDSEGTLICQVGCDVSMDEIINERRSRLIYCVLGALIVTVFVIAAAIYLVNRIIIKPLNSIAVEMPKFSPVQTSSYMEAGVISLDIKNNDEIGDIYRIIRTMQINIIDSINDMAAIQSDMKKVESHIRDKDKQLGRISREMYRDTLTGVGSKTAYDKKTEDLSREIASGDAEFAIVMVDVNNLKQINDSYGHSAGDGFLRECCRMVCDIYKHSPAYRIGGDEFVIILTGIDYRDRNSRLSEIRSVFESAAGNMDVEPWLRYSAAVGMAEYTSGDSTYEQVFTRADKAMYEDKQRYAQKGAAV